MKLDKDLSKATKSELVQILRLCIGKHCDECPLANEYEFDRDACYRILMVRVIDEFNSDRKKMDEVLSRIQSARRNVDEMEESLKKIL